MGILFNRRLLPLLTWKEIDDLLFTPAERRLLKGITLDDLDHELRWRREVELHRYRLCHGLLDIDSIESMLFKQQFRFAKEDLDELYTALLLPDKIVTVQNVTIPGLPEPSKARVSKSLTSTMSSCSSKAVHPIVTTFGDLFRHAQS